MPIDTYDKLLAMYLLQKTNLATYKTQVGATAQDIEDVASGADNLQYMKDYFELVDADKRAVAKIKQTIYDGDPNTAIAPFGGFPAFAPPSPLIAGLEALAQKRNRRFKAAQGYTKDIGISLGIDGDSQSIAPETVKPAFEAFPASRDYEAAIVISNRGNADRWEALAQKTNSAKWLGIQNGTGKAGNLKIVPTVEGQPERLLVMIQLYKNNEPYGQPSAAEYVTFNP